MERTHVIWIVTSVGLLLVLVLVAGLVILNRSGADPNAPIALGPSPTPSIRYPDQWVAPPSPTVAPLATGPLGTGDQIVIGLPRDGTSGLTALPTSDGLSVIVGQPQGTALPLASVPPLALPPRGDGQAATPLVVSRPSAKPAATPRSSSKPTATATVKSSPKPAVQTEFWIQAASFQSRTKADDLKTELARSGLAAVITTRDIDGKTFYRVRIGPYATEREATGWLERVRAFDGCSGAYVSAVKVSR